MMRLKKRVMITMRMMGKMRRMRKKKNRNNF
jgi:hypothetical protein